MSLLNSDSLPSPEMDACFFMACAFALAALCFECSPPGLFSAQKILIAPSSLNSNVTAS